MKKILFIAFCLISGLSVKAQENIDLSGLWDFCIGDSADYNDDIFLPGSMLSNEKVHQGKAAYTGKAWYRRMVYIPQSWEGKNVTLFLERPHVKTHVYVNGAEVGGQNSVSTPHQYEIAKFLSPGQRNKIEICVNDSIQEQCNWNGIVGQIELRSRVSEIYVKTVKIFPNAAFGVVEVEIELGGSPKWARWFNYDWPDACVSVERADIADTPIIYSIMIDGPEVAITLPMDNVALWDEFHPQYYRLGIFLGNDYYMTTFGMREISVKDRNILLNGRPLMLRGTVEDCSFQDTDYPPMDEKEWARIIGKYKQYGLNHMRFRSWCPPEAAFAAADRLGFYLMPEATSYQLEESKRILDTYGHHPSFVMMSATGETAGKWVEESNEWIKQLKKYDPAKLYCGAAVSGDSEWDSGSDFHVKGEATGLDWDSHAPHSDDNHNEKIDFPKNYKGNKPSNSPMIAHELGQWGTYLNMKSSGRLGDSGILEEKFIKASGNLQTLCYKYDIERNLRTKDYSGFQLKAFNEYSGQSPEWIEFCSPVVPLAKFPKFVYSNKDTLDVPVELYNAMYAEIVNVKNSYYITDDTMKVYGGGTISKGNLPIGNNVNIGKIRMPLDKVTKPTKLTLSVLVAGKLRNHWDFWVYPEVVDSMTYDDIYQTDTLDAKALDVLKNGGKVLITAAGKIRLGGDVMQHFLPDSQIAGAYIDKSHPLFRYDFPTDDWGNLNWWELLNKAQVMNIMELPKDYQSPILPIDNSQKNRKLGMLIEANVLNGKLLMTSMDINSDLEHRLVARQMRHAIMRYMHSDDFKPAMTLQPQTVSDFFVKDGSKEGVNK